MGQARLEVSSVVDFEEITTNKPMYFLYKDFSADAEDATDKNGLVTITASI